LKKYLNYLIFAVVVLLVVGIAVNHSRYVHSLVSGMGSPDSATRSHAALELVKTEQFSDSITGEEASVRLHAVDAALSLANDKSVVPGTEKDAPDYRSQAVKQDLNLLKDIDKKVRAAAVAALKQIDYSSAGNLSALIGGVGDGDSNVRKGVARALTDPDGIGPRKEVVEALVEKMKGDAGTRGPGGDVLSSPRFLKEGAAAIAVPKLLTILTEKDAKDATKFANDEGARSGAADALGKIGDPRAVQPLIDTLKTDTPAVQRVAIGAIALIAAPAGEAALIRAIKDKNADSEARLQAAAGLGKIASPASVETLIASLNDPDLKMRSAAVAALAHAGRPALNGPTQPGALQALITALGSANEDTRKGAADALARVAAPEADTALITTLTNQNNDSELRAAAATALGFPHNKAAVPSLITALSDRDGDVRDVAQAALVQIGPEATDALIAAMQAGHTDAFYAAQAVAQQGLPAMDALKKLAADTTHPVGQRWAAVALGDMGVAEAAQPLQLLAKSSDPDVAYVAQAQLARLGQVQAQ
jgi:HEAT repeat protein